MNKYVNWNDRVGWMVNNTPYYADVSIDWDGTIRISGSVIGPTQHSDVGNFDYYPFSFKSLKTIVED